MIWQTEDSRIPHATKMKFEHLVQINDSGLVSLQPLTRAQLWQGLVARAYQPSDFLIGLESCTIRSEETLAQTTTLQRTLDFGAFKMQDTLILESFQRSTIVVAPTEMFSASRMSISIEEPVPGELFLRFTYEWEEDEAGTALDSTTTEIRKQAYKNADLDTVQRIREMAHECRPERHLH